MQNNKTPVERFVAFEFELEDACLAIKDEIRRNPAAAELIKASLERCHHSGRLGAKPYSAFDAAIQKTLQSSSLTEDDDRTVVRGGDQARQAGGKDGSGDKPGDDAPLVDVGKIGSDATEISSLPKIGDATVLNSRTELDSSVQRDLSGFTGQSSPSSWRRLAAQGVEETKTIGIGTIIRERYELVDKAGEGGMGVIYKAKDLLNVEAEDRNPYVAIKILNDAFKEHPDSLKALHREATKAQRLAHPNIITVYNFDKDAGHVFMTMEFLMGRPLDEYIADYPAGQPLSKVKPIIRGMAEGLAYAHSKSIIHSDFKPSNVFVEDGLLAKIIDFGIARAAKSAVFTADSDDDDADGGDKTNFDAGELGALTPSYASAEMLQGGVDPSPGDDIYALACISYELLCGKHPFIKDVKDGSKPKKIRADEAQADKLKPKRIKGISRQQWQALERGLIFARDKRCSSAKDFADQLCGIAGRQGNKFISTGVGLVVLGAAAYVPLTNYLETKELERLVNNLKSGNKEAITKALIEVNAAEDKMRRDVIITQGVSEKLAAYFIGLINEQIDASEGRYFYPKADDLIREALVYYPDSFTLNDYRRILLEKKNKLLNTITGEYNELLSNGLLLPEDAERNMGSILDIVAQIDPEHAILSDIQLEMAYVEGVRIALRDSKYSRAKGLVNAGMDSFPSNASLINLKDKIVLAEQKEANIALINTLEEQLLAVQKEFTTLDAFKDARDIVSELRLKSPDSKVLNEVDTKLEEMLTIAIEKANDKQQFSEALIILSGFNGIVSKQYYTEKETYIEGKQFARDKSIDSVYRNLMRAIALNNIDEKSEGSALVLLEKLKTMSPGDKRVDQAVTGLVKAYVNLARQFRLEQEWDKSLQQLAMAQKLEISSKLEDSIQKEIANTNQAQVRSTREIAQAEREQIAQERAKKIAGIKADFSTKIKLFVPGSSDASQLIDLLEDLAQVSPTAPLLKKGRSDIANAYLKEVNELAKNERFSNAIALAKAGTQVIPESIDLSDVIDAIDSQKQQYMQQERKQEIDDAKLAFATLLSNADSNKKWEQEIPLQLDRLQRKLGEKTEWVVEQGNKLAALFLDKAKARKAENRFSEAEKYILKAKRYASDDTAVNAEIESLKKQKTSFEQEAAERAIIAKIKGQKQTLITQANADDTRGATATLAKLAKIIKDDDTFIQDIAHIAITDAYERQAQKLAKRSKYQSAIKLVKQGLLLKPDHAGLQNLSRLYEAEIKITNIKKALPSATPDAIAKEFKALAKLVDNARIQKVHALIDEGLTKRINDLAVDSRNYEAAVKLLSESEEAFPLAAGIKAIKLTPPKDQPIGDVKKAEAFYAEYIKARDSKNWRQAKQLLPKAKDHWSDSQEYEKEVSMLQRLAKQTTKRKGSRPCKDKLAGYGKRSKGVCFDVIAPGKKGPLMVVVKPGGEFSKPFAIGRTEVSIGEYNAYCKLNDGCQSVSGDDTLPITGISIDAINKYAEWLTDTTGYDYRMPDVSEWEYAAKANGKWSKQDANCRITQGAKLLKGRSLIDARIGDSNGWGLKNMIGNASELVMSNGKLVARGGSFKDGHVNCEISLEYTVSGAIDTTMGFRLLRQIK